VKTQLESQDPKRGQRVCQSVQGRLAKRSRISPRTRRPHIRLVQFVHREVITAEEPGDATYRRIRGLRRTPSEETRAGSPLPASYRRRKHAVPVLSPTPSDAILSALDPLRHLYAPPGLHSNKLDLSHHDPMSISESGRPRVRPTTMLATNVESLSRSPREGLRTLLAQYIRWASSEGTVIRLTSHEPTERVTLEKQLSQIFSDDVMALLRKDSYDFTDVDLWAWILTAESSDLAATRLWTLTHAPIVIPPRSVPHFVFNLVLRRQDWNARSLKLMLMYAWSRLTTGTQPPVHRRTDSEATPKTSASSRARRDISLSQSTSALDIAEVMIVFVRLLRHARKVYPEAMVSITALLAAHLMSHSREARIKPQSSSAIARVTFVFNSALSLLSYPASMRPFQSIVYQQRAQFDLLRAMNEFEPPLTIDRGGYRAVTRVQLAHKKSLQERDWAAMKAKSWPPWKEDRLGLDTEKGPNYGVSRAGESMLRRKETGYPDEQWDDAARIMAGWDTDESPTVQTRTLLSAPIMSRRAAPSSSTLEPPWQTNIWAARIRATRTIDEAWACFLAYQDTNGPSVQDVCYAMFEKLVFEEKRIARVQKGRAQRDAQVLEEDPEIALPGDSPSVYEKPSPREAIYVRTSPPGTNEFFELTLRAGIRPSGRFLAFILKHAKSFELGLRYLRESALPPRVVYALLSQDALGGSRTLTDIGYMSEHTFAAFVQFLSQFSPAQGHKSLPVLQVPAKLLKSTQAGQVPMSVQSINPLLQAYRLLLARKPFYRPPWNALLSALARSEVIIDSNHRADTQVQDVLAWSHTRTVLSQMGSIGLELDFAGFQIVCVGLEKAIFAAAIIIVPPVRSSDRDNIRSDILLKAKEILEDGLPFVKSLFKRLVTNSTYGEKESSIGKSLGPGVSTINDFLPRLLEVPSPAQLHAFIRVLGLREDFTGIHALIEWMSRFAPELQVVADEAMNGRRLLRRCLIAARVFLEQSWTAIGERDEQTRVGEEDSDEQGHEALDRRESVSCSSDDLATGAAADRLERMYELVQEQEDWGGWPTDKEVEAYCRRQRR